MSHLTLSSHGLHKEEELFPWECGPCVWRQGYIIVRGHCQCSISYRVWLWKIYFKEYRNLLSLVSQVNMSSNCSIIYYSCFCCKIRKGFSFGSWLNYTYIWYMLLSKARYPRTLRRLGFANPLWFARALHGDTWLNSLRFNRKMLKTRI